MAPNSDDVAEGGNLSTIKSNPQRRMRWATKRATPQQGGKKRQSILQRFHKRTASDKTAVSDDTDSYQSKPQREDSAHGEGVSRSIFFNIPLPQEARDEEGHPRTFFPRNKIRTAKYTPLSFIPKNLYFQFHQIANIYFLFIVCLSVSRIVKLQLW